MIEINTVINFSCLESEFLNGNHEYDSNYNKVRGAGPDTQTQIEQDNNQIHHQVKGGNC